MSSLQVGRLQIGPAWVWHEAVGDPVTNLGGAVIPAPRQALRHMIEIGTVAMDGDTDTIAERLRIRRQMRSMLNNTPLKLQAYLYVVYSDDPEQNGWYVPDFGSLVDLEGSSGLATGVWKLEQVAWLMAGHKRINREARNIWMKDLRLGLAWRDQLKAVYSTAFTGVGGAIMQALQFSFFPSGANTASLSANGSTVPFITTLPVGRDGGMCGLALGLADLSCVSFERPDISMGLSDVIVYDRRGNQTAPFYLANILSDNPLAYWRLNEPSGTVATNQVSTAAGTYTGSYTLNQAGALTGGLDNDASVLLTGGWVDVGNVANTNMSAISVECWFKATSLSGSIQALVSNTDNNNAGFRLKQGITGGITFQVGNSPLLGSFPLPNPSGVWHHTVGTWDGTTMTLYIDGVFVTSQIYTGSMGASTIHTQIGANNSLTSFPGNIDEVAIYQYALLPKQVSDHYAAGTSYDGGNQWEEVFGPDYSWSWVDRGLTNDTPVISNGLCRVRYDSSNTPGLRIDVWQSNGSLNGGAGWVEQGKLCFKRIGDSINFDDTFVSAALTEWTPDRAVIQVVLRTSLDTYSRERIYVTMDRGIVGCTIECYPAQISTAVPSDINLIWNPALTSGLSDINNSIAKIDSQGTGNWTPGVAGNAAFAATAGSGAGAGNSTRFPNSLATLGNTDFGTSENWVALLRCPSTFNVIGAYQTNIVVIQDTTARFQYVGGDSSIYGIPSNNYHLRSLNSYGYIQAQISFAPSRPLQIMEAESMTIAAATTSSADSTASGGTMTTTNRTSDAIHVSQPSWPDGQAGVYRVFARIKSTAATSSSFYAKTAQTTGATVTISTLATPVWQWIDLGEITDNNATLEIHAWRTGASGSAQVDRIEAVLVQDRTRVNPQYSGVRDAGQSALFDSRQLGAVVARI